MAQLRETYVADFLRIPFSRSRPTQPERDVYNSIRMDQALGMLIRKLLDRTTFKPEEIGDAITGCAFQTGENWLYGGRSYWLGSRSRCLRWPWTGHARRP
jgi:acetyl-CoA C-acetyltransferase